MRKSKVNYDKEPSVRLEFAKSRDARGFLGALIIFVFVTGTLVVTLSVLSNHYGYFGNVGQFEFYNGRLAKVDYLKNLAEEEIPDAWIMGSSNMMPFQTSLVEELFDVDHAFNLGAYWGRAEDQWAWSNYIVHDLHSKPKLIILGIEPWTFADDQRGPPLFSKYRRRLLTTPELAQYLPEFSQARRYISIVLDSLTFQSIRLMLRMSLRHRFTRVAQPTIRFDPKTETSPVPLLATRSPFEADGTSRGLNKRDVIPFLPDSVNQLYAEIVPTMQVPGDILLLDESRRNAVQSSHVRLDEVFNFLPGDKVDPTDVVLFDQTLDFLNSHDVPVIIIMLPMHPYFFDLLITHTKHAQHLDNLRNHLRSLEQKYPNIRFVYDASHVARFGGDPSAFHDRYHMTPDNTDLVLRVVAAQLGNAE